MGVFISSSCIFLACVARAISPKILYVAECIFYVCIAPSPAELLCTASGLQPLYVVKKWVD